LNIDNDNRNFDSFLLTHVTAGARKEHARKREWAAVKTKAGLMQSSARERVSFLDGASPPRLDREAQEDIPAIALITRTALTVRRDFTVRRRKRSARDRRPEVYWQRAAKAGLALTVWMLRARTHAKRGSRFRRKPYRYRNLCSS